MTGTDLPPNPRAERPMDLLTADLLQQIHELGREKLSYQGHHMIVIFCRKQLGCELSEISIDTAKWIISKLQELPEHPEMIRLRMLPPRNSGMIEGTIAPPPVLDFGGPKL